MSRLGRPRTITDAEREHIVALRRKGTKRTEIQRLTGRASRTISDVLSAAGLVNEAKAKACRDHHRAATEEPRRCSSSACDAAVTVDAPICPACLPRFEARRPTRASDDDILDATSGGMSPQWAACMAAPWVDVYGISEQVTGKVRPGHNKQFAAPPAAKRSRK